MKPIKAIVLAAGRGTRMKSDTPKVLHEVLGSPIICRVLDLLKEAGIKDTITVAGFGADLLKKRVSGTKVVIQKKLLGSGNAVLSAKAALGNFSGDILITCGDAPLIKPETIRALVEKHRNSGAALTVLTAELENPSGYGRIERRHSRISRIVEEEKILRDSRTMNEVNVGTYCFKANDLFAALAKVKPDNKKKEFFLTDTVEILYNGGRLIESVTIRGPEEMTGTNKRSDLAMANTVLKNRVIEKLMSEGVTIEDPSSTVIQPGVRIGRDTKICANTVIESDVEIGANCRIGPFARIRPGTRIGKNVEIGNFVELVRAKVGDNTKVKHHTYLGDTVVGKNVNIGAGTITANYDGKNKNRTVIEDGCFIGVGAILIAPVKIGRRATVGAGSVVPKMHNVPALATVVGVPAKILKKSKKRGV